jgi:hypothetical protein
LTLRGPLGQVPWMQLLALEPGTWAEWANTAATTLAFTVALVLFVIGLRDRRRADDDRLRDQVRKVWIWHVSWSNQDLYMGLGEAQIKEIQYKITNDSSDPISQCYVDVKGHEAHVVTQLAVGPTISLIPAHQSEERTLAINRKLRLSLLDAHAQDWRGPPLMLTFTMLPALDGFANQTAP